VISIKKSLVLGVMAATLSLLLIVSGTAAAAPDLSVGAQYDSTHVYLAPADLDAFVEAFTATFGGRASPRIAGNVLPVPSHASFQYVFTPAGTLSLFGFDTPVPFPFGSERTGYLVTDLDAAVAAARASGAEVLVAPFKDAIGRDAVVRWPGGVETQLYWHLVPPSGPPLSSIPENRVYVSPDAADEFVRDFLLFSHGTVESDSRDADGGEIGRPGHLFRSISIESGFGRMRVMVTDGHLPFPFGRELTGYQVEDLDGAVAKALRAGATLLSPRYDASDRTTAMLQFPGGYICEVHAPRAP
jgi:hypothetical protein